MTSGNGDTAADLFWEYLSSLDAGKQPDLEALLERAGDERGELERRIATYGSMADLASDGVGAAGATPDSIGRYAVQELVGTGGLGSVYRGYDDRLDRSVALKLLDRAAILGAERRLIVVNEARVMAHLDHPNVAQIYEVDTTGEADFLVMEYVSGPSLHEVIVELLAREREARDGSASDESRAKPDEQLIRVADASTPIATRVETLARLADALHYCHERGVLHRDIKPANVLFDGDNEPRLVDFGLAHLEKAEETAKSGMTSRLVGTAAYVAPEQVDEGRIGTDPRSEVFSLGTLAYEFLTLWNPFERGRRTRTLEAVTAANPKAPRKIVPTLPIEVEAIVLRALQRDPADRYPTLREFAQDLRAVVEGRPIRAMQGRRVRTAVRTFRRHSRTIAVALLLVLAVATAFVVGQGRDSVRAAGESANEDEAQWPPPSNLMVAIVSLYVERYSGTGAAPPIEKVDVDGETRGRRPTRALLEFAIEKSGRDDPFEGMSGEDRGRLLDEIRKGGELESFLEALLNEAVEPELLKKFESH